MDPFIQHALGQAAVVSVPIVAVLHEIDPHIYAIVIGLVGLVLATLFGVVARDLE